MSGVTADTNAIKMSVSKSTNIFLHVYFVSGNFASIGNTVMNTPCNLQRVMGSDHLNKYMHIIDIKVSLGGCGREAVEWSWGGSRGRAGKPVHAEQHKGRLHLRSEGSVLMSDGHHNKQ